MATQLYSQGSGCLRAHCTSSASHQNTANFQRERGMGKEATWLSNPVINACQECFWVKVLGEVGPPWSNCMNWSQEQGRQERDSDTKTLPSFWEIMNKSFRVITLLHLLALLTSLYETKDAPIFPQIKCALLKAIRDWHDNYPSSLESKPWTWLNMTPLSRPFVGSNSTQPTSTGTTLHVNRTKQHIK